MLKRSYLNRKPVKRSWIKRGKSPRKIIIDKVKLLMRQILKIRDGGKCFFCGKPESHFKYPLSLFHILPVSRFPKLELELENTVLACWSKEYFYHTCHNDWEDRVQPKRKQMEEKLLLVKGMKYEEALKIQNKCIYKLDIKKAEWYLKYYTKLLEELKV